MDEPITDAKLAAWEALCAAATEGPWHSPGLGEVHCDHENGVLCKAPRDEDAPEVVADLCTDGDAAFIVAARTALPALIAEVRRLQQEILKGGNYAPHQVSVQGRLPAEHQT